MKLVSPVTLLALAAVAMACVQATSDKPTCADGTDGTPTVTPTPTTEAPIPTTETPIPTTQTPAPTPETPAPTTEAPTPAPTTQTPAPTTPTPGQGLTFENAATGKSLVVSALPVAEGVCYTFYPCIGGFATAMTWDAPLWADFDIDRSTVYFFKTERCGGDAYRLLGLNEPIAFIGDYFPQAKSVLFRTDPSAVAAVFDPSFITRHASCS